MGIRQFSSALGKDVRLLFGLNKTIYKVMDGKYIPELPQLPDENEIDSNTGESGI